MKGTKIERTEEKLLVVLMRLIKFILGGVAKKYESINVFHYLDFGYPDFSYLDCIFGVSVGGSSGCRKICICSFEFLKNCNNDFL